MSESVEDSTFSEVTTTLTETNEEIQIEQENESKNEPKDEQEDAPNNESEDEPKNAPEDEPNNEPVDETDNDLKIEPKNELEDESNKEPDSNEPENKKVIQESSEDAEKEQVEDKEEFSEVTAKKIAYDSEEKPSENIYDENKVSELSTGLESEDAQFSAKINQAIEEADEANKKNEAVVESKVNENESEITSVDVRDVHEGSDLTIEKLLSEIDDSKIVEEVEVELEYDRHVLLEMSHITLNPEELPEIRGLAELEYESPEDSKMALASSFEDVYLSKRKSARPSMAARMIAEELAAEKRRQEKKEAAKGMKASEGEEKKVEAVPLTREEYYALYEKIMKDILYIRMKNKFLQRKMADNLKRRKMEHALREEHDLPDDVIQKYEKKLDRLSDLFDHYNAEVTKIGKELDNLRQEKEDKYEERTNLYSKVVSREREIGIGLISTKTGKEIPEKFVDQLIRRQTNGRKQISELRLKFIAKRDELAEKTAELKSLDNIGEDLSLMDYEQLRIENRAHSDKLEEKEEELTKLRVKCRNTVQIMAHVREKCAALDADRDVLKEEFDEVNYQYIDVRERLNFFKTERDAVRNKTMKLKAESGLLTKPKLLLDMETSMQQLDLLEKSLRKIKREYNEKTQQIRNLRKNIAYEMAFNKKHPREKRKKQEQAKFFKARPTLIAPKLPKHFLNDLGGIKLGSSSNTKIV